MTKLFLIVKAEVEESIEDQWNEWYNTIHVPEVMACPGFLSARRLLSLDKSTYIAIYELESEAAINTDEFRAVSGWGVFSESVRSESGIYDSILSLK